HVLLDARVEVADARTGLGDRLPIELEDEAEDAVRGGVLRAHVEDDPLLGVHPELAHLLVPAATLDVDHVPPGAVVGTGGGVHPRGVRVRGRHQLYDLRSSGGGMVPPLYSTGMPPRG